MIPRQVDSAAVAADVVDTAVELGATREATAVDMVEDTTSPVDTVVDTTSQAATEADTVVELAGMAATVDMAEDTVATEAAAWAEER